MVTLMVVLAAWVVLSLPAGMLVGTLFSHQRRGLSEFEDALDFPGPAPATGHAGTAA